MTLVNTETGETFDEMGAAEAEQITDSIAWRLDTLATAHEEVMPMIREALARRAWDVLGYRSPGDYASDRFGGALTRLSIPVRQAVVQELTDAGMSTRAIAPVVGVSDRTVASDQKSGAKRFAPDDQTPEGESGSPAPRPNEGTTVEKDAPRPPAPVLGIDGKTYSRPTPKPTLTAEQIADAFVEQFPALHFFQERGEHERVNALGRDLSQMGAEELEYRLSILDKTIAHEKREIASGPSSTAATTEPDAPELGGWNEQVERGRELVSQLATAQRELMEIVSHVQQIHALLADPADFAGDVDYDDLPAIEEVATFLADLAAAAKEI